MALFSKAPSSPPEPKDAAQPENNAPTIVDKAYPLVLAAVPLALAAGAVSYVAMHFFAKALVPLEPTDIAQSSWIGYTHAQWAGSMIGIALPATLGLTALFVGVALCSLPAFITGSVLALSTHFIASPEMAYRASIAAGNAKVGCFVWDSKECHALMGLNNTDARSMYLPLDEANARGTPYADWYDAERPKALSFSQALAWTPTGLGTNTLSVVWNAEKINKALAEQRAELQRRKQAMLAK